ncbi:RNA 2',3'-cyclic phosphodiesterase [Streptacidiphilus carbonis]|uniref:RNA 2',3'-cyclic phosphodiesterase n=1 Tax=Streptacidiphilus carbonis TaxID=105422 RepID=UPI0005A90EB5|nr:RNA 2',3'-cyclic phosphodiesterase [Streptacidiphilus carbonis]
MRLFAAVLPPETAISELADAVAPLHALPQAGGLRWTGEQTWHLTLAFLGQVDAEDLDPLRTRLGAVAAAVDRTPRLRLAGSGSFGERALWVGLAGDTLPLRRLADEVVKAARDTGIDVDERPFRGHLTLARSAGRNGPPRAAGRGLSGLAGPLADFSGAEWPADSLRLMRSHLGAGPAHYETVAEWALGAGSAEDGDGGA